jgi:hypothetical protein
MMHTGMQIGFVFAQLCNFALVAGPLVILFVILRSNSKARLENRLSTLNRQLENGQITADDYVRRKAALMLEEKDKPKNDEEDLD